MYWALCPGVSGAGAVAGTGAPELASCSEIDARLSLSADSRDCERFELLLALAPGRP